MNVIVIIADSLRRDHLGCYGNPWISTPNLDRFAPECALFEEAYSEGLPTLPTRTAWWTGRYTFPFRGWQHLEPSDALLAELDRDFADILEGGRFERSAAFPEESDLGPEILALPRLKFRFNRKSFGRLRQLIDRINLEAPMPARVGPAQPNGLKQLPDQAAGS